MTIYWYIKTVSLCDDEFPYSHHLPILVDIAIITEREIRFLSVFDSDIFPKSYLLERIKNGFTFWFLETYPMSCFQYVYTLGNVFFLKAKQPFGELAPILVFVF